MNKLKICTRYTFDAPIALLICANTSLSWKCNYDGKDYEKIDVSIVATHMIPEATALKLGTTFVGYFDPNLLRELFSIPENMAPVCILSLVIRQKMHKSAKTMIKESA